ncbi:FAD-dependent oxidoreductase [Methylomagnum ishizawai]|uniref:FAD-dependent oxidoreductase n=1 Tax=Methylomagnum ishizawai TaxID=1760988 RepID=UPI001C332FF1|nr:FAD-dependent oxidoreductase [Methylomagnum ishizawai]BBL77135.1 hypothetical protein MishRS11D_42330 [Methylomagnum ishizawai]
MTYTFLGSHPPEHPACRGRFRHRLCLCLALVDMLAPAWGAKFDVVVVGAGSGGVSAALQAARLGARVALLEETDWIGGQMTAAGVSTMDGGAGFGDSGIYGEFIGKVKAHYARLGKSVATCYWSEQTLCFEPRVGQAVLRAMLAQYPQIELFQRQTVVGVGREGMRITGVSTRRGDAQRVGLGTDHTASWESKVVVDATEYGDVLALLPAPYRAGTATSDPPDPDACIQDITYVAIVRKYPDGVPESLRLKHPPPGYGPAIRDKFAAKVRRDGGKSPSGGPVDWPTHNAYRGLPDSALPGSYTGIQPDRITRTGINMANDLPATVALFDRARRKGIQCEAKLRTLQFLYYMQGEPGQAQWGVADDEGYDTPYNREENNCASIPAEFKAVERNLPPIPYVRESRRLIGLHTLTAGEIKRVGQPPRGQARFPDAVAVGDYAVDLHGCWKAEPGLDRSADLPKGWVTGPFEIPFGSFIPLAVDGVVAAEKNLSQSRYANGATRLQPITMLTGQAAGAIAALAVRKHVQPRAVPPGEVQAALRAAGVKIGLDDFRDRLQGRP